MSRNSYTKVQLLELMEKAFLCMTEDYQETLKQLRAANFIQLGSGNYGSAWEHKDVDGWVIKVCGRVDGDSYPAYAFWGAANPMPGVPEFKHPTFSPQHDVFMVMLPRYDQYSYGSNDSSFDSHKNQAERACYGYVTDWHGRPLNQDIPVVRAGIAAGQFFGDLVQWDLHSGNFMIDRELDILVMTDPIHCGANNQIIAKVYGRDPVRQSWGFQNTLQFPAVPAKVVQRAEFNVLTDGLDAVGQKVKINLRPRFGVDGVDNRIQQLRNFQDPVNGHRIHEYNDLMRQKRVIKEWDARGRLIRDQRAPLNAVGRGEIRAFGNPVRHNQMFNLPKLPDDGRMLACNNIDWKMLDFTALEQRVAKHRDKRAYADRTRVRQDRREARLAYWVRENNLKPEQVRKLGEIAQDWSDDKLHRCGGNVQFAVMPEHEPMFLPRGEKLPSRAAMIQHVRASAEIVATLRDWWRIEQDNRGRVGWGGRFARQVNQFRNFIR